MKALFLRLLAASLAALVAVQVLGALSASFLADRRHEAMAVELLDEKAALAAERLAGLPAHERPAELHVLRRSLAVHLALEAEPGPPWVPRAVVHLPDGTPLTAEARPGPPPPLGWIFAQILLSAGAFAGIVAWAARPLVRELEVLERVSRAIAGGDLRARTGLSVGPVGEVGARIDAMADRVERELLARKRLLEAVSHELRTPAARMRFQLEALSAGATSDQQRWIDALDHELAASDALLADLLSVQRLDAAPEEPAEPEASGAVVAEVVARMAVLSPLPIELEGEGRLPIGRKDLRRILENLLSNAQRHARGRVVVRVRDRALQVEDDGPGVAMADRERIFEPFTTLDESRSRELGGVGLGLALVARAAARWGATASVEDGESGGARFVVRWPTVG